MLTYPFINLIVTVLIGFGMLHKTEIIEEILKRIFASGHITNAYPLSAIIIAGIGGGKSSLLKEFIGTNKEVVLISDVTAYGIIKSCYDELRKGTIKHIIIPDLITPLSKAKSTKDTFISFMNGLIEEGIMRIETYSIHIQDPIKCGLVTSIAKQDFESSYRKETWQRVGFISRMLPITFSYSDSDINKILEKICKNILESSKFNIDVKDMEIQIDETLSSQLVSFAKDLAKEVGKVYPFRQMKQLGILAMANALLDGRNIVEQKDIDWVRDTAIKYINLKYREL
jgi:hypothetical protein